MLTCTAKEAWLQCVHCIQKKCSKTAFENWISPILFVENEDNRVVVQVPNVFVRNYLLDNYKQDLCAFLPVDPDGEPLIEFTILPTTPSSTVAILHPVETKEESRYPLRLNKMYQFDTFIEGPSNQFVKSAAMGIAKRPGRSYNPFFIHGGVGLGKTHLLHAIGHYVQANHPKLQLQCITTEAFINDLVDSLRNKTVEKMKQFYRNLDVLLVDDIQFLQNRLNFEEELSNTFEALINQSKQIIISSDKSPGQLQLSERMIARMEWGLVAHIGMPDLETRVAILQHKAQQRGMHLPQQVAFYIAENIFSNVRQLEGAINRLSAYCRLLNQQITEEFAEQTLSELFQQPPKQKVSVEAILKTVAMVFQVRVSELKGTCRTKEVALARQVAMFLAKEMISESLIMIASSFGKTHSTILHACKTIEIKLKTEEALRRQLALCRKNISSA